MFYVEIYKLLVKSKAHTPLHVLPLLASVYPLLQEQVKDPSVLVQT